MAKSYNQTPTERLDYGITLEGGDTIASVVWTSTASDAGAILTIGTPVNTPGGAATKTKARIQAVRLGITFTVKVHIIGATGQEYDHYFHIFGSLEKT